METVQVLGARGDWFNSTSSIFFSPKWLQPKSFISCASQLEKMMEALGGKSNRQGATASSRKVVAGQPQVAAVKQSSRFLPKTNSDDASAIANKQCESSSTAPCGTKRRSPLLFLSRGIKPGSSRKKSDLSLVVDLTEVEHPVIDAKTSSKPTTPLTPPIVTLFGGQPFKSKSGSIAENETVQSTNVKPQRKSTLSRVFSKCRSKIPKSLSSPAGVAVVAMEQPSELNPSSSIDDSSFSSYATPMEAASSSGYSTPMNFESGLGTPETSQSLSESLAEEVANDNEDDEETDIEAPELAADQTLSVSYNPLSSRLPANEATSQPPTCGVYIIGSTLRQLSNDPSSLHHLLDTQDSAWSSSAIRERDDMRVLAIGEALANGSSDGSPRGPAETLQFSLSPSSALLMPETQPVDSRICDKTSETLKSKEEDSKTAIEPKWRARTVGTAPLASSESSLSSKLTWDQTSLSSGQVMREDDVKDEASTGRLMSSTRPSSSLPRTKEPTKNRSATTGQRSRAMSAAAAPATVLEGTSTAADRPTILFSSAKPVGVPPHVQLPELTDRSASTGEIRFPSGQLGGRSLSQPDTSREANKQFGTSLPIDTSKMNSEQPPSLVSSTTIPFSI